MQNNYTKVINNLNELGLHQVADNLPQYINFVNEGQKNMIDALFDLTEIEMKTKAERAIPTCIKVATSIFKKL